MPLTAAQQELRRTRLTGSSIAGLLGRSPWDSPLEAWELQRGLREFAGNDDTEAGNFMEDGIGRLALHKLPIDPETAKAAESPGTLLHPEFSDVFAVTPDLIVKSERIGIQIKNHLPWAAKRYRDKPLSTVRWHNHLLPGDKLMQCLLELDVVSKVYGGEWVWFLAAYFGGSHLRVYWIRRDTRTIEAMLAAGRNFWRRHLDPAGPASPPSPDCTCGGCGRGQAWWIGRWQHATAPMKLTPKELLSAPLPFGGDDDDAFGAITAGGRF